MTDKKELPPPNGFMRNIRRFVAVACFGWFSYFLSLEFVLGTIAKPIPVWLYGLLFTGSLMMFEAIDKFIQRIMGNGK